MRLVALAVMNVGRYDEPFLARLKLKIFSLSNPTLLVKSPILRVA